MSFSKSSFATALTAALLFAGSPAMAADDNVVNIYNWVDYIGETTLADFEAETGIKTVYDTYDAAETVEAKLLAGHSGYDAVISAGSFMPKMIQAGVFLKIDKSKLPNYKNLDPSILKILDNWDPGNNYGVPYMWGTVGITYNVDMIKERMPDAPMNSLDMLFKPELAKKWADCGISVLDSPGDIVPMALAYLGRDPGSENPADYEAVVELIKPIRQYIKTFDSANYLNALPNKELCMAFTWSGDYATATSRAADAGVKINLTYVVPDTGSPTWFDVWNIPNDASHVENAYKFLNYMLDPKVIAAATDYTYYANANKEATALIAAEVRDDPAIYPDAATMKKLFTPKSLSPKADRARTRAWSKIKTGQ
jgi:putrescine transport system substrate-binding protein